jgi:hypothetical protein
LMSCKDHVTILEPNGDNGDIDTWVDSDWAGDRTDRKSLDCIVVKVYDTVIHVSSKGQGAQAQSSAEAELGGIHRGSLFAIGVQNFIHEVWGELLRICIWTDSSSGKVMSVRRGVGRTRHLEVWQCYIQAIVNSGRVKVRKCLGTKNVADAGTKPPENQRMQQFMGWLGIVTLPQTSGSTASLGGNKLLQMLLVAALPSLAGGAQQLAHRQLSQTTYYGSYPMEWIAMLFAAVSTVMGIMYVVSGGTTRAQATTRPATTTRRDVATQTVYNRLYPDNVYMSRTGVRYHLHSQCGGLSGNPATPKSLCQTCAATYGLLG